MTLTKVSLAPSRTACAGVDLLGIVRINEEIKMVVGVAFKINIMALNAIFLAKRAGTAALGFGVLSNELRVFSQDLRNGMQDLTRLIYACVGGVSCMLQDERFSRFLRKAATMSPHARVNEVLERRERKNSEDYAKLSSQRRQLKLALENLFQLVELGGVLAKSAKIEAAYGQAFAGSLAQVSGEFDHIVEEIRTSLESLRKSTFLAGK